MMENRDQRNPGAIRYFDRRIDDFDNIYNTGRSGLRAWLDRTLRASVRQRFQLAFDLLGDINGKSVLDVVCGSGRYMFEALRRGTGEVVGLDAASGALEVARRMAGELGFDKRVKFIESDFMDLQFDRPYDIIFAVGYFDYILSPQAHLEKMLSFCDNSLFASFPRLWHPMTPVRKMRLALSGCPVRFYSYVQISDMMRRVNCKRFEIRTVSRDFALFVKR
jgi:ubiquinone/menaquinone biosynthesis C-methylase UbiE